MAARALRWLAEELEPLARLIPADDLVYDSDRREEFARLCLAALDLRPQGETVAQAQNRLAALSTVERGRGGRRGTLSLQHLFTHLASALLSGPRLRHHLLR